MDSDFDIEISNKEKKEVGEIEEAYKVQKRKENNVRAFRERKRERKRDRLSSEIGRAHV